MGFSNISQKTSEDSLNLGLDGLKNLPSYSLLIQVS